MLDDRTRDYADWYVWAKRNLTSTSEICHAAAQAAVEAKAAGKDPQAAARDAATSRGGLGWTQPAETRVRQFAEWYDWARVELGITGEDLLRATSAAVDSLRQDPDPGAAASAARAALAAARPAEQAPSPAPPPPAAPPGPEIRPLPSPPPAVPYPQPAAPPPAPPQPPPQPPPPPQTGAWSPPGAPAPPPAPATPVGTPYPGAALPPPPSPYQPGYGPPSAGAVGQVPAYGAPATGRVEVPVWVAVLLGIGCAASLVIAIVYGAILAGRPGDQSLVLGSAIFLLVGLLMFFPSLIALVGVVRHSGWARAMSIVAGAAFCLSCVGIVFGVPVIIGAAMAKPQSDWRPR